MTKPAARGRSALTAGFRPGIGWLLPRHPGDVVRVGLAAAILVGSAVLVHRDRVAVEETDVFRVFNDLPAWLAPVIWPVMQLGNLAAVPIAAAVAAASRRFRLAVEILFAGAGVWLLAKVAKHLVVRGRPATLLPDVHIHGAAALGGGYLSGHAAVAFATATLVSPYVSRGWRRAVWALAVTVCVARLYVGAHLPLDVVGGAALGWGAASLAHLVLGAPSGRPSPRAVRRALSSLGLPPVTLTSVADGERRSAAFHSTTREGDELFVKVIPPERRDRDLLYRIWLWLSPRRRAAVPPGTPREQAEHEAAMALAAERAGVRTPRHVVVGRYPNGGAVLVNRWVDGRPLARGPVDDTVAADARRQLSLLHAAGQAHGHVTADNLMVTSDGEVFLVDFDRSSLNPSPEMLIRDVADLEAVLVGNRSPEVVTATGSP
jgi:undecaprenyl-diphosphatase